jgi:hypothetical protein
MLRKQIKEDYKNRKKNQAVIFGGNSRPNCTPLCLKMEKKIANSRSN